jgi:protein involved in polysaccharide export with SLBB domain
MFKIKLILLVAFMIVTTGRTYTQVAGGNNILEGSGLLQTDIGSQLSDDKALQSETLPIGNTINPDYYIMGPGDMLSIQVFPFMSSPKNIYVTPDCAILLPRLGELNLINMNLTQVRDTISKLYKNANQSARAFVTLRDARKCLINIKGNVTTPSIYTLPASYQVSTAITFANRFSNKESGISITQMESVLKIQERQKEAERLFSSSGLALESQFWRRNVKILRNDGTSQIVDLEKATVLNDPSSDPFIKEGDEIIIPYDDQYYSEISISGAVVRPVMVPFKKGDKASLLLKFGYGLTDDVNINDVKLFLPSSGKEINLTIDSSMHLLSKDYELEPGSKIIVGQYNNFEPPHYGTVTVKGNIKSPGSYLIKLRETRLKEIIEKAGGFTEKAYLPLAKVMRRQERTSTLVDPRKEIYETFQYSDLKSDDTNRFYLDIQYKKPVVSSDINSLYNHNTEIDNVMLQDGDIIIIPASPGYIEVMGQVKNPGIVEFQEGKTMRWYIERTGGYAEGSEEYRARIIRGRTNVWIEGDEETLVFAGDRIYVPRVPDEPTSLKLQRYAVYAGIIGTISSIINIIFIITR